MIEERIKLKAINASIIAGLDILKIYNDPNSDFSIEKKADNSPLTIADKVSHNIIVNCLKKTDYPILSEEGSHLSYKEREKWDLFWLIDPIDGTKEFINKNGEFTVNIALVKNGEPIFGVIYVPVLKLLYVGESDIGAWKLLTDKKDISWNSIIDDKNSLPVNITNSAYRVVASRSFMNKDTEEFIEELKRSYKDIDIVSKGSSLKICMVAEGSADIYPRFGPTMEWDTAAGHAIALGAGKSITLSDQKTPLSYNKKELLNPYFIVK